MKTNEERLEELLAHLDSLDHIHVEDIPKIDLYMDQVTTFMEDRLGALKRYPEDKVLTKTMINNYAKNNLLPSPVRKKYTQEHILLLIFIYYFKNLLNFNDIETVLSYITEHHFGEAKVPLSRVYSEIFLCAISNDFIGNQIKRRVEQKNIVKTALVKNTISQERTVTAVAI